MSDDPFLYNDQLRSSAIGWNNMPDLLQKEIFQQLGCFRLVGFRRVCQNWKSLLEEGSRVLWMDDFFQTSSSPWNTLCHSCNPKLTTRFVYYHTWKAVRHKCESLRNHELATWFVNSHKGFSKVLQGVYKKARVIVVDFARQDCASKVVQEQLYWYIVSFVSEECSVALASDGHLKHLILTGGRTSPDFYFGLLQMIRLDNSRRPLKVTLLKCSIKYTASDHSSFGGKEIGAVYHLLPQEDAEVLIPEFSFRMLPHEHLYRKMLLMFEKLFFPYSSTQIEWLETCLRTVQKRAAGSVSWGFPGLSAYCVHCLKVCTLVKRDGHEMVEADFDSGTANLFQRYLYYVQVLAVALSYFARMISTGELAFPPPPEPVMLCPVHTKSAICFCMLAAKDADKSLKKGA